MKLYDKLVDKEEKLSLVGLGYVGMPIAVAFARKINVIGFDLNAKKIEMYKSGIDPTHEVGDEAIRNTTVDFTSDEKRLSAILGSIYQKIQGGYASESDLKDLRTQITFIKNRREPDGAGRRGVPEHTRLRNLRQSGGRAESDPHRSRAVSGRDACRGSRDRNRGIGPGSRTSVLRRGGRGD